MKRFALAVIGTVAVAGLLALGSPIFATAPETAGIPVYAADGSVITNPHIVTGIVEVTGFTVVTLNGPAAFTSVKTYTCAVATTLPGPVATPVIRLDGRHFKVAGGADRTFEYSFQCIGN